MQLLPEEKLIWSPIVANSRMNRERKASGINSYEKEFKFKPEMYLELKIKEQGQTSWLDLCCGQGNALIQTAGYFLTHDLQNKVRLKGIDLLDAFLPIDSSITCVDFSVGSVVDWVSDQSYDLITCSHGIHYLGDKLKVIESAIGALHTQGMFVANLDLANIIIEGKGPTFIKNLFKKEQVQYNSRSKILQHTGQADIRFGLTYIGADDNAGPNYTGQEAVTSHYAVPN